MYKNLGIDIPYRRMGGKVKTYCPKCRDMRHNKKDKSLSVNLDEGLYKCHYCGWSGCAKKPESYKKMNVDKLYTKPEWKNNTKLSDKLVRWFEARQIMQPTLSKMQISEGEEYMPQKGKKCNTLQFNYFKDGELINVKYRTGDKCFKLVSGAELILWNIDAIRDATQCIITEGEIDALSFIECGFDYTVSVPNGANGTEYLDNYIEDYFDNKEVVYIATDNDSKGIELRNCLISRFGIERCKIVSYGEGCKDANEHLVKYGKYSLQKAISEAEDLNIEGVFSLMDYVADLDSLYINGLQRGYTIGHSNFDKLCSFEMGRLCVVTGIPGHGKSEFVDEIAMLLNLKYKIKFAYFSPENYPTIYLLSKLISKITGKRFEQSSINRNEYETSKRYIDKNFSFIYPPKNFTIDEILDKAKFLIKKKGIKGLIIDPYNKIEHQIPSGMTETNYISMVLDRIIAFAQQYHILIFMIAHPRKMPKKSGEAVYDIPSLYDINGSANFYNKADYGISVYRDRVNDRVEIHVQKVKFRHLGECGTALFHYNLNNGRYVPYLDTQQNVNWNNENYLTERNRELLKQTQNSFDNNFFTTESYVPF